MSKHLYKHTKIIHARQQNPGSISLWTLANAFCRDHRRQGFITFDEALDLGTPEEIQALLDAGLWIEVENGYQFHDWTQWNSDFVRPKGSRSSATWIVQQTLPDQPHSVQTRLAVEVEKLIEEGHTTPVLVAALQRWGADPKATMTWLAYFVSNVLRENETGVFAAIKQARTSWDMSPLLEYGYRWTAPDLPDGMHTTSQIRHYRRQQKAAWLDGIEAQLKRESTQ